MANSLEPSQLLHRAASDQLAWILGNNAVKHSFVTVFGTNPVLHPWHWTYKDYGIVMPGWAVGGPNLLQHGVTHGHYKSFPVNKGQSASIMTAGNDSIQLMRCSSLPIGSQSPWRKIAAQSCKTTFTSELFICIPPPL